MSFHISTHPALDGKVAQEVFPGVFLGPYDPAVDEAWIRSNKITHVVSAGRGVRPPPLPGIQHVYIDILDTITASFVPYFVPVTEFMRCALVNEPVEEFEVPGLEYKGRGSDKVNEKFGIERGQNNAVYVHCAAGVSRSVCLVIAYGMRVLGLTYRQAFEIVKNKRDVISPNNGFRRQLVVWEQSSLDSSEAHALWLQILDAVGAQPADTENRGLLPRGAIHMVLQALSVVEYQSPQRPLPASLGRGFVVPLPKSALVHPPSVATLDAGLTRSLRDELDEGDSILPTGVFPTLQPEITVGSTEEKEEETPTDETRGEERSTALPSQETETEGSSGLPVDKNADRGDATAVETSGVTAEGGADAADVQKVQRDALLSKGGDGGEMRTDEWSLGAHDRQLLEEAVMSAADKEVGTQNNAKQDARQDET
uniref:Uncharacterized protein n=1 Tax=Chromera velia CCMP2878 TaxID=1169474 RepID=A0A0G4I291_9ALVE|mmetsp:Transcript_16279/g.33005  ORF Transcript_16279/g.33005 Transcript_16279/m.33005 type:complete len:426 (-) Transcript_16279:35-1312(-)|eukprot:Cvel_10341.t1-p1 / transcript=Cvel_10341.t1 / gene=Cvel_10341 / organism=Chromera_velia_CCMP2878 / gene_product=Dual specificity protein phosphatase 22, putative / transcript_product=Dual specificity protein phosphatase 22, putative / location=Cvel_scaffold621:45580-47015(+) / protein_length=425 / sequence_SO=supercontig / SO=protein_coding / is_pseudo=false